MSCNNTAPNSEKAEAANNKEGIAEGTLKVMTFHAKQRCITCEAIEKLTSEVVAELNNSKIMLEVIDISDAAKEAIADKYEVAWTSLILDNGKKVNNLTEMAFKHAKNEPEVFKQNLKTEINKYFE